MAEEVEKSSGDEVNPAAVEMIARGLAAEQDKGQAPAAETPATVETPATPGKPAGAEKQAAEGAKASDKAGEAKAEGDELKRLRDRLEALEKREDEVQKSRAAADCTDSFIRDQVDGIPPEMLRKLLSPSTDVGRLKSEYYKVLPWCIAFARHYMKKQFNISTDFGGGHGPGSSIRDFRPSTEHMTPVEKIQHGLQQRER
jgi:hypothetical protein